jgi:hypothetical protein
LSGWVLRATGFAFALVLTFTFTFTLVLVLGLGFRRLHGALALASDFFGLVFFFEAAVVFDRHLMARAAFADFTGQVRGAPACSLPWCDADATSSPAA